MSSELIASSHLANAFQKDLLEWFERVRRDLPWRRSRDPYRIWLSEIMLQQTRVDQVEPYFNRFAHAFPTLEHLAAAPLDDVLKAWEGLGYYSRARNLHRAAKMVMEERSGYFPASLKELRELPGVGPYTAAAVASIAFGLPHAVVDGNVARVASRVFGLEDDVKSGALRREVQERMDGLISRDRPGVFNEAVMELGATVCVPRNPACSACPLSGVCKAYQENRQHELPVSAPRARSPHYDIAVGLILHHDRILIQRRDEDAMLGGLWEFPGGKQEANERLEETCRREVLEETGLEIAVGPLLTTIRHAYSHFRITMHAFVCRVEAGALLDDRPRRWVHLEELELFAFPRANVHVISALRSLSHPELFGGE